MSYLEGWPQATNRLGTSICLFLTQNILVSVQLTNRRVLPSGGHRASTPVKLHQSPNSEYPAPFCKNYCCLLCNSVDSEINRTYQDRRQEMLIIMKIRTTALIIAPLCPFLTYIHLLVYKIVVLTLQDCCKVKMNEYVKVPKPVLDA